MVITAALLMACSAVLAFPSDRTFRMSADSMWPNYPQGSVLTIIPLEELGRPIQAGDAIAFTRAAKDMVWVKRVIGIGGDKVEMSDGIPILNGRPLSRERLPDRKHGYPGNPERAVPCYSERISSTSYQVCELAGEKGPWDTVPVLHVPAASYFVLGDNRDNSRDSRDPTMGPIEERFIIGVVKADRDA